MKEAFYFIQILISALLIFLILIQKRESALGSGEFYPLRRGLERKIFYLTIFVAFLFIFSSLVSHLLK